MIARKENGIIHVNAEDAQVLIDEGGYEFLDDDGNEIDNLDAYIKQEIAAHTGHASGYADLMAQLKAQGINLKGE